jgi:hypothetical protein
MPDAAAWIRVLNLAPHPEGGHYRRTFASPHASAVPGLTGKRLFSSAIFFLLQSHEKDRLHRLKSDEMWHFYDGSPLTLHLIQPSGEYVALHLGLDPELGQRPQVLVSAGAWFGATVDQPDSFTLAGCTVTPGFDFTDFDLADRADLIRQFPAHAGLIEKLTEPSGENAP